MRKNLWNQKLAMQVTGMEHILKSHIDIAIIVKLLHNIVLLLGNRLLKSFIS